jgi:hypothetical protein
MSRGGSGDKEATTKSFIDLQERFVATDEAVAKARMLEFETKTKALEAEAKARFLEAEARTKLLETEAKNKLLETETKTKLLEAEAMLMAEENKIMLTNFETISDSIRQEWLVMRFKPCNAHA